MATDYGDLPCVHNNLSPLDGCNEFCEVEKGWECTEGAPINADTCWEICGDGFNMNNYQCDDGNVNWLGMGNDGCSWDIPANNPKCQVDAGFECNGLFDEWSPSECNEICGDGLHYGNQWWNYLNANECDDGNNRPGDGCDPTCRVEKGWQCAGGTN